MSEVLYANIFFFITGIAVIIFTFLISIALYHLIKVLKAVRRIVDRIEAGTETITEDFERLRTYVTEESFLSRFFGGAKAVSEEAPQKSRRTLPKGEKGTRRSKTELRIKNEE